MSGPNCLGSPRIAGPRCVLLALALICAAARCPGADPVSVATGSDKIEETNAQETLRSYLQLQEQLHAVQLAIDHNRKEAEAATAERAKALAVRLEGIEQSLAAQRSQELKAMESSNRVMLVVAGGFATLGFLAMLFMAYFQWRTINRLAEITASLPVAHALGSSVAALGGGDSHVVTIGPPEQANQRLLGALEQLEKRIHELEHTTQTPLPEALALHHEPAGPPPLPNGEQAPPAPGDAVEAPESARITVLLGKGQSLLNLDKPEEAVACFDQVLALDARHPEALVKKGAALERLRKLDEAIVCYDRAIAADNSLTVAYLYKGGLFNRLERFGEALECYEKALRTQEVRHG